MTNDVVEGPFGAPVPLSQMGAQLRAEELSLFDATAVAVSSVAPAYSLTTALTSLFAIGSVGLLSPAMVLLSFIPILFVAHAYFHLNRRNPNCGASYSWLAQMVHPAAGWFNGFLQVGISVVFCVQAPTVASSYTLGFLHSLGWIPQSAVDNTTLGVAVAAAWLALITVLCVYGIRWTTNFQWVLVILEYTAVIAVSIGGIIKVALSHHGNLGSHFRWSWFDPFAVHGIGNLATSVAIGTFLFWGWDTALNLNEESRRPTHTPGHAAILSMWLLLGVFLLNFVAAQMLLPVNELRNANIADILLVFGQAFGGRWIGWLMILAVLTSTVATTETTLLPAARITYSMARDRVFFRRFGDVNERFQTPVYGTVVLAAISLVGVIAITYNSSASSIISTFTNNVGALVAFYYGITGLTCAWAYRHAWRERLRFLFTGIVLPALSGLALLGIVVFDFVQNGWSSMKWDIVLLVLATVLTPAVWWRRRDGMFFQQPVLSYATIE